MVTPESIQSKLPEYCYNIVTHEEEINVGSIVCCESFRAIRLFPVENFKVLISVSPV